MLGCLSNRPATSRRNQAPALVPVLSGQNQPRAGHNDRRRNEKHAPCAMLAGHRPAPAPALGGQSNRSPTPKRKACSLSNACRQSAACRAIHAARNPLPPRCTEEPWPPPPGAKRKACSSRNACRPPAARRAIHAARNPLPPPRHRENPVHRPPRLLRRLGIHPAARQPGLHPAFSSRIPKRTRLCRVLFSCYLKRPEPVEPISAGQSYSPARLKPAPRAAAVEGAAAAAVHRGTVAAAARAGRRDRHAGDAGAQELIRRAGGDDAQHRAAA